MSKKILLLAIHGMGDTKKEYADPLWKQLKTEIGENAWGSVLAESIYYQDIFQENQNILFDKMKQKGNISWLRFRRLVLFGFSDALGLERNPPINGKPPYEQVQEKIRKVLEKAFNTLKLQKAEDLPVVIIAQSLGCYIISNYIWDAQREAQQTPQPKPLPNSVQNGEFDSFCRLKSLKTLITTGCNIPIFVAGYPQDKIKPIKTNELGYSFDWHNFYDEDDVLGWPLEPLYNSDKNELEGLEDHEINAGGLFTSWNPLNHESYWSDSDVIDFLKGKLKPKTGI